MKVRILSTKYYDNKEMLDKYPLLRNYKFEMVGNSRHQVAYITVKDLDNLLKFIAELEIPVIFWYDYDNGTYNAEIYDDCRE